MVRSLACGFEWVENIGCFVSSRKRHNVAHYYIYSSGVYIVNSEPNLIKSHCAYIIISNNKWSHMKYLIYCRCDGKYVENYFFHFHQIMHIKSFCKKSKIEPQRRHISLRILSWPIFSVVFTVQSASRNFWWQDSMHYVPIAQSKAFQFTDILLQLL